jgi:aspartate racemase
MAVVFGCARVGVLGGIGPEATAEFYRKLIERIQEEGLIESNTDFPQIVINSIPAPELIYDEVSEEELKPYIEGLRELERFGVDFIVMVCNTIHLYYNKLQSAIETEILDLRAEVRRVLNERGAKATLVIGTPNTIKRGLYRFEGIKSFEPSSREIKELSEAIFNFNRGIDKQAQIQRVKKLYEKYLSMGAEAVILGCTEFAVMLSEEEMPKINTIDVLVDATIRKILLLNSSQAYER